MDHRRLLVEIQDLDGNWRFLFEMEPTNPPGSFSTEVDGQPGYIMFGWYHGEPGVWTTANSLGQDEAWRVVSPEGLKRVSGLAQPCEVDFRRPTYRSKVRFTLCP